MMQAAMMLAAKGLAARDNRRLSGVRFQSPNGTPTSSAGFQIWATFLEGQVGRAGLEPATGGL